MGGSLARRGIFAIPRHIGIYTSLLLTTLRSFVRSAGNSKLQLVSYCHAIIMQSAGYGSLSNSGECNVPREHSNGLGIDAPHEHSNNELHRHLSLFDLVCVGVGATIGSGVFVLIGLIGEIDGVHHYQYRISLFESVTD